MKEGMMMWEAEIGETESYAYEWGTSEAKWNIKYGKK